MGRHPWLLVLSVLGVALGVAVVVSIDLANSSARRAFELSSATVAGKATHHVVGLSGGLDEGVYRRLRVEEGIQEIAPVIDGYVRAPRFGARTFQVLGIDPFAEDPFRPYLSRDSGADLTGFLTGRQGVYMASATAQQGGLEIGDTLHVKIGGRKRVLRVAGLLEAEDDHSARALEDLIVVDISTAQSLFDAQGRLSRIDVLAPPGGEGEARLERIRDALPVSAAIERSEARTETIEQMTDAFNLNLTALSFLALMVGMFLIYNTMTFSVVQRRTMIGQLRALGVTRREIGGLIFGDAMLVGIVGTACGLLLGIVLGRGLVRLITQTINDLYYVVNVRDVAVEPLTLVKGASLGIGATLLAAIAPAREATRTVVSTVLRRSHVESDLRGRLPRLAVMGAGLGILAVVLLALPTRSITVSYLALLGILIGFALLTPAIVMFFARMARRPMGAAFGIIGRMASRGVAATMSRTAVAISALMIAIASTVGVGVMVSSFRETVVTWLDYTLQADIYIQPPSLVFRTADQTLDPVLVNQIKNTPGVAGAYTVRRVRVASNRGATELVAVDPGPQRHRTFRFKEGDPDEAWRAFAEAGAVLISEPYSFRHGLGVGDSLILRTDQGARAFPVAGVYYDYASDLGVVMMSRSTYDSFYDDRAISGISLDVTDGESVDTVVRLLQERAGSEQDVLIRPNRVLREASLEVFDRTFTITAVLRLLAVLVAFVGVLSALMALQLERAQELAVLRANGMTPRQVWRYVSLQTCLMGLISGLLAIPLGLTLAYVLVYVINQRSFGWTLQFEIPASILVQAIILGVAAALLAGLYPSWKMSKANPARALRTE